MFKVVLHVPKPLLIFLNSCFFILFWLDVCFSFWSTAFIWAPISFTSLLVPCTFSFISVSIAFIFLNLICSQIQPILWASWLPVFWTVHLIGWLSLCCLVVFFSGALICSLIWAIFFVLAHLLRSKGWSPRYTPRRGNPRGSVVVLNVGEGSERGQCCLLSSCPAFSHFPCCPQGN